MPHEPTIAEIFSDAAYGEPRRCKVCDFELDPEDEGEVCADCKPLARPSE